MSAENVEVVNRKSEYISKLPLLKKLPLKKPLLPQPK